MKIATSIYPSNLDVQLACVRDLQARGFQVILVQPRSEKFSLAVGGAELRECEVCPPRIDDLLAVLPDDDYGGIINSDVFFRARAESVRGKMDETGYPLTGQRWECNERLEPQKLFVAGFDYFFFHGRMKKVIGPSPFQIGRPAWDYWIPIKLLEAGPLVIVTEPLAFHISHPIRWSSDDYIKCVGILLSAGPLKSNSTLAYQQYIKQHCLWQALHRIGKVAIFIRCCGKHAPWLEYCVKSIKKFASGFEYVMVTHPQQDRELFKPLEITYKFRRHEAPEQERQGMLMAELKLCHADEICPDVDHILFMDCDSIFTEPVTPGHFFVEGLPVLLGESFDKLFKDKNNHASEIRCKHWCKAVEDCLGFTPEFETMVRQPIIHTRSLFAPFREAVQKHTGMPFDQYVLSCRNEFPQTFAEFPALGAFALKHCPEKYCFVDIDGPAFNMLSASSDQIKKHRLLQKWSHGGVTPEIKAEFEAHLR